MSTSDLFQRMPAVLIFSLGFTFLTSTVTASENSIGRTPFLISNEDEVSVASQEASAIPEQASSNWAGLSSLKFGEQEDTSSVGTPGSLAEVYLKRLAGEQAWAKMGWAGLLGGALLTAAGVYMFTTATLEGQGYAAVAGAGLIGSGLLMGGVGLYYMDCRGRVERQIDRLLNITDPVQRERVGHETLASLAHGARVARIAFAVSIAGFAAAGGYIFLNEYGGFPLQTVLTFATLGSMAYFALKILTAESPEEIAFQKYLEENKQGQKVGLRLGIDPSGGVRVALVFSF